MKESRRSSAHIDKSGLKATSIVENRGIVSILDDNFKRIANDSIDLILTDPPFNIARDTNFHTYEKNTINSYRFDKDKGWDTYEPEEFRELLNRWAAEFARVLKPEGNFVIFCADEYISDLIGALRTAGLKPRRTITWRKPNAVPVNRKHMMMSACEYLITGVKKSNATFNSNLDISKAKHLSTLEIVAIADKISTVVEQEIRNSLASIDYRISIVELEKLIANKISEKSKSVAKRSLAIYSDDEQSAQLCVPNYISFNSKSGKRLHPTEKPVQLLIYLIELFSKEGQVILDPFAGSGSLGEAAFETNRNAILVEKDIEFYEKSKLRLMNLGSDYDSSPLPFE